MCTKDVELFVHGPKLHGFGIIKRTNTQKLTVYVLCTRVQSGTTITDRDRKQTGIDQSERSFTDMVWFNVCNQVMTYFITYGHFAG